MRRLVALVSAIVLVDTLLYAALVPLLPDYAREHGLSKTGAGLLLAAYAAGVLGGALPAGLAAARLGAKPVVLAGLALMAVASLGFGLSGEASTLAGMRVGQGLGSALSWAGALTWLVAAAPHDRRGELLGVAVGAAVFGALLGPAVGAAAAQLGPPLVFAAVAALAVALLLWTVRTPGTAPEPLILSAFARALPNPVVAGALWLMLLPALLFGVLEVLVPLRLAAAGWSATAIGAVFFAAAALEIVVHPLFGRLSDRRGGLLPVRLALVASVAVALALAWARAPAAVVPLALVAGAGFGGLWTPTMALLSRVADRLGIAQGLAFGLVNVAWAAGALVGPAAAGFLADVAGDTLPYALGAALSLATLAALQLATAPGTLLARVPKRT